jgi:hypothetical protein
VKLQDECLAYTDQFCAKNPEYDRRMMRESFILQKVAGTVVLLEDMTKRVVELERR